MDYSEIRQRYGWCPFKTKKSQKRPIYHRPRDMNLFFLAVRPGPPAAARFTKIATLQSSRMPLTTSASRLRLRRFGSADVAELGRVRVRRIQRVVRPCEEDASFQVGFKAYRTEIHLVGFKREIQGSILRRPSNSAPQTRGV